MSYTSPNTSPKLECRKFYLLRLWLDDPEACWRASLQGVSNGEWRHFPDLESLYAFLKVSGTDVEKESEPGKNR
ncbi:MAG: hypothetical protein U9R58_02645 [Chloroflexota bacterium]|nr:hypothetical protein [Chloroflexota bacterium]